MKRLISIIIYLLLFFNSGFSQLCIIPVKFSIEECEEEIFLFDINTDTTMYCDRMTKYKYLIILSDCMGESEIQKTDTNGILVAKFYFRNGLDTLIQQDNYADPFTGEFWIGLTKYFEAIPTGVWLYYNERCEIIKRKYYTDTKWGIVE